MVAGQLEESWYDYAVKCQKSTNVNCQMSNEMLYSCYPSKYSEVGIVHVVALHHCLKRLGTIPRPHTRTGVRGMDYVTSDRRCVLPT
jgi:hypothetical protein